MARNLVNPLIQYDEHGNVVDPASTSLPTSNLALPGNSMNALGTIPPNPPPTYEEAVRTTRSSDPTPIQQVFNGILSFTDISGSSSEGNTDATNVSQPQPRTQQYSNTVMNGYDNHKNDIDPATICPSVPGKRLAGNAGDTSGLTSSSLISTYEKEIRGTNLPDSMKDWLIYNGIAKLTNANISMIQRNNDAYNASQLQEQKHVNTIEEDNVKHDHRDKEEKNKHKNRMEEIESKAKHDITKKFDQNDIEVKVYEDENELIKAKITFRSNGKNRYTVIINEKCVQLIKYVSYNPRSKDTFYALIWSHENEQHRLLLDAKEMNGDQFLKRLMHSSINLDISKQYAPKIVQSLLAFLLNKRCSTVQLYDFNGWNILESGYRFVESDEQTISSIRREYEDN